MGKHFGATSHKCILAIAGMLVCAGPAFGTPSACPTTTGTVDRTFTGGTPITAIAPNEAAAGVDDLNTLQTAGGCTAINATFSNFAVASTLNSGTIETGNALPTLAGTYLASTAVGTLQDTLTFATLLADVSDGPTVPSPIDGLDNFKVNKTENITDTTSYSVTAGGSSRIYDIVLDVNGITVATGGSGTVEIDTCTGSTLAIAEACSGGAGTALTQTITLASGPSLSKTIALTNPAQFVFVTQVINLVSTNAAADANETGFLTFSDEFDESPEPSTFVLLGTALAGVALLRFRRRNIA